MKQRKVLLIYTGGTIGMKRDPESNALEPVNFDHIFSEVPELARINCKLEVHAFSRPIDSSDMNPDCWIELVSIIEQKYAAYDGFVILHGSDTMAYSASALSFLLEHLRKPVIFTGSQLPIGTLRTDGRENLITAIEIAADYKDDIPRVPEVAIYFEYSLYRGNRARKVDAEHFRAFETLNYPLLAEAGVHIKYNDKVIFKPTEKEELIVRKVISQDVAILKFFPGINPEIVGAVCSVDGLRGLVIETFGSGNAPGDPEILTILKSAIQKGLTVLNVSQCHGGSVRHGKYQNSVKLEKIGVISGHDMTTEAAITKMMYLLGNFSDPSEVKHFLTQSLRGELSPK